MNITRRNRARSEDKEHQMLLFSPVWLPTDSQEPMRQPIKIACQLRGMEEVETGPRHKRTRGRRKTTPSDIYPMSRITRNLHVISQTTTLRILTLLILCLSFKKPTK
jgi:hypothetical protein